MKFFLHEVKLWFKNENSIPKSYEFLLNKVNVVTGDATTGKTSFWSIIDYCLLSNKINIANKIVEKVSWFGIRFTINDKEISIVRKSPIKGAISSEIFYAIGSLPNTPNQNIQITELKSLLDKEFGIKDNLRFSFGKELGKSPFNLSYRYFLLFNCLTEDIIGASKTYFDTTLFGKDEYDKALKHIFNMVIGVNDMENMKALERIGQITKDIAKILGQRTTNTSAEKKFESGIFNLIYKLKQNRLLEYSYDPNSLSDAVDAIDEVILTIKKTADNSKIFAEIDGLNKTKYNLKTQISAIARYRKEYDAYKRNLNKNADSLKPIEFLKKNLTDQLVDSYETTVFIDSLEESLKDIQNALSKKVEEPLNVSGDARELQTQLQTVESKISRLSPIKQNFQTEANKFIALGEVKNAREQFAEIRNRTIKPIDTEKLNELNDEKVRLETEMKTNFEQVKFAMKTALNEGIQRNYNKLKSMPEYIDSRTQFDDTEMTLKLYPEGLSFPIETVGSKSNYMFMHLCFYLGLHEHMITVGQEHVPQFLFIDQPSIPYYSGNDASIGNDDKSKLLDAFSLLNSFIDYIRIDKKNSFQIFMVEHAPKEYWTENSLTNFHTVAEFINGNGLIPTDIYKA
jgi:hypothetical protein